MPTFRPPTQNDTPTVLPERHPGNALMRHYQPRPRGRTVLRRADGTYETVDTPTTDDIDAALEAYIGGHIYPVDDDTATRLTDAGYTVDP